MKWFPINYLKDLKNNQIQYFYSSLNDQYISLLFVWKWYLYFLLRYGWLLAWLSTLLLMWTESLGLEPSYPTSIPIFEFVSLLLLYRKYLPALMHDLTKAKKGNPHSSLEVFKAEPRYFVSCMLAVWEPGLIH